MKLKKLLPKNFDDLLAEGDVDALKAVFAACSVDARGGYSKQTALAFNEFPDELCRWLVEQGADVSAADSYGDTPLQSRAGHWQGRLDILLDLGADVHSGEGGGGAERRCTKPAASAMRTTFVCCCSVAPTLTR